MKAFDKVHHRKLLHKLKSYGFGSHTVNWIESFLVGRKQRVVMGDYSSEWCFVDSGVPQGSVLGPLLFIIYINDISDGLQNVLKLYADDGKLFAVSNDERDDDENKLQADIDHIAEWCSVWSMELSPPKCKVMSIGRHGQIPIYFVEGSSGRVQLGTSELERDLGVMVSSDCRWRNQVNAAASKANRVLGMMRNTFRFWTDDIARMIYPTFIRPHLEFASSVWNPSSKSDIQILENVQHRATRTVESRHLAYEARLGRLNLSTLRDRRERGDFIQCYKIVHGLDKISWVESNKILHRVGQSSGRRHPFQFTREIVGYGDPRHFFLLNRMATPWNNLPKEIVLAPSVNSFKSGLDSYLREVKFRTNIYLQ